MDNPLLILNPHLPPPMMVYQEDIETPLLEEAGDYYTACADEWLAKDTMPEFLKRCSTEVIVLIGSPTGCFLGTHAPLSHPPHNFLCITNSNIKPKLCIRSNAEWSKNNMSTRLVVLNQDINLFLLSSPQLVRRMPMPRPLWSSSGNAWLPLLLTKAHAVFVSGKRSQLLSHVKRPTLCSSAAPPVKALPYCSLAPLRGQSNVYIISCVFNFHISCFS